MLRKWLRRRESAQVGTVLDDASTRQQSATDTHCTHRPGQEFRAALELPGWDHESLWGWELGAYLLQLVPNYAAEDGPDLSIVDSPATGHVALRIFEFTGADPLSICRALRILPASPVASPSDVARQRMRNAPELSEEELTVLSWCVGEGRRCPASELAWTPGVAPTFEIVAAEQVIATGMMYTDRSNAVVAQYDEALTAVVVAAAGRIPWV